MFGKSSDGKSFGQATFESSLHGLGTVLAAIAALLFAGDIWDFTADPVYRHLLNSYGDTGLASLGTYVWGALSTAAVFFICRAVFILTLMLLAEQVLFRLAF